MFNKLSDLLTIKQKANQDVIDYLENDFWLWFDGAKHMTPLAIYSDSTEIFEHFPGAVLEIYIYLPNQLNLDFWQSFEWPIGDCNMMNDGIGKLRLSITASKKLLDYLQANQRNIYAELQKINPQLLAHYQS